MWANVSNRSTDLSDAQMMRFDASMESLINIGRSESFADLKNSDFGAMSRSFTANSSSTRDLFSGSGGGNAQQSEY